MDTRLSLFPPTKSLGMRLGNRQLHQVNQLSLTQDDHCLFLCGQLTPGSVVLRRQQISRNYYHIMGFSPPWELITCPTISQTESITTTSAYLNDTWDGKIQRNLQKVKALSGQLHSSTTHTDPSPLLCSCTQAFIGQLFFFAQATHKFRQVCPPTRLYIVLQHY